MSKHVKHDLVAIQASDRAADHDTYTFTDKTSRKPILVVTWNFETERASVEERFHQSVSIDGIYWAMAHVAIDEIAWLRFAVEQESLADA